MKRILKIAISSILLLTVLLGTVSCGAPAAQDDGGNYENISWEYDADSKTLTLRGKDKIKDFETVGSQPWASALASAEKIIILDGITAIGDLSFYGASALKSVSLPSSLTEVGRSAFAFCQTLEDATLPLGVTAIENGAFSGCSALKAAFVPASVTTMGSGVFSYCYSATDIAFLAEIDIPEATFTNCRSAQRLILRDCFKDGGKPIHESAFEGASVNGTTASYTDSPTASASVKVVYVDEHDVPFNCVKLENGELTNFEERTDLAYGAAYSFVAPSYEGYTPETLNITGNVYGEDKEIKVKYTKNPEPVATEAPVEEPEEPITAGTIVSVAVLVLVLVGIGVAAFFIIRNEKKASQKDSRTVRKNDNTKKRK